MARINSFRETGERYPLLRFVASAANMFGALLLALAALLLMASVASFFVDELRRMGGIYLGLIGLIWSFGLLASAVQVFALAMVLHLAIHVEENTRATAQALDRLRSGLEPKPDVDPRAIFLS